MEMHADLGNQRIPVEPLIEADSAAASLLIEAIPLQVSPLGAQNIDRGLEHALRVA